MNGEKNALRMYLSALFVAVSFNLYFIVLMQEKSTGYLLYLDLLLLVVFCVLAAADYRRYRRFRKKKQELLGQQEPVCEMIGYFENQDIAMHDVAVLREELKERFEENCELQDYVARWCHEMKLPLSAGLLLTEEIRDVAVRGQMREQFERMKQQLGGMLLGCKLQSALFDLQIEKVSLLSCVRASIRNHQFFLIQKKISLEVSVEADLFVYSDPGWLVYLLDQLLGNAVKYIGEAPVIRIAAKQVSGRTSVFVEDNGAGIRPEEQRRIFEKGFTGNNYHNGKYKSTGMGLYMAKKIADRLGHELSVESEYGVYSRFWIRFGENDYFRF